jgi:hypothetical protein
VSLNALAKNSTSTRGNGAECDPWPPSALASTTLLGQAMPATLSAANHDAAFGSLAEIERIVTQIRAAWPDFYHEF